MLWLVATIGINDTGMHVIEDEPCKLEKFSGIEQKNADSEARDLVYLPKSRRE
jgi:hypothetical protein